jgi:hypothetical protein
VLAWNTKIIVRVILLPWSIAFEDPIPLTDGRQLFTLEDAADCMPTCRRRLRPARMAKGDRGIDAVQPRRPYDDGAHHGHAGLNRHVERFFTPNRQDHRGGKRKLKTQ